MMLSRLAIYVVIVLAVAISGQASTYPKGPGCGALLTDAIVGYEIVGTASLNSSFNESHALLNSSNAWCSLNLNTLQYLRFSLDKPANLSGFELQGRSSSIQYVTKFQMRYKANADAALQLHPKEFDLTPTDGDEIVSFPLNGTTMQTVIFYPSQWNEHICMRLELYGCVPVDGGYTPWSDWTPCSNSCGGGSSVRYRMCSDPAPANGGQDCFGDSIETKECIGQLCPVDGGFSDWSNWTACSASCGTGFQSRQRTCTNPPPMYGGEPCQINNSTEVRSCLIKTCILQTEDPDVGARKSDDEKDEKKYFIPMLVLAVAFAIFVVIAVAVICLLRKRSERKWNNNSVQSKSSEHLENGDAVITSPNLAKG